MNNIKIDLKSVDNKNNSTGKDKMYFELGENFKEIINKNLDVKTISEYKLIETGWTNIVYEVKTTEGNYFFRFPRDEFWSRTIVKDCQFANFVYGKTKYDTIKLELKYDNGRPFSMHKKIEGVALAERLDTMSDEDLKKVSFQISDFMHDLHNVEYKPEEVFSINNIGLYLPDFLDELLDKHVSPEDKKFWTKESPENKKLCLVHGDLNSSNIIVDENNNLSAVIDFGFGGYGNKYDDISRILSRGPERLKNNIISAYEQVENKAIDRKELDSSISTWNKIDGAYINYMRKIGIYE